MHQRGLSANFLGCSIQLHQRKHRHWGSGGLDQEQVFGGPRRWSCSTPQPQQNGECLCHHWMGCRFQRSSHLTKCHFLCWNDGLPCTAGTNQSGVPEWGTRKKLPSTRTARTSSPKRRGFCKGDSGRHSCTADLPHYEPIGYARLGRGSDYHGLFEIWCQLQWIWWSGWPSATLPVEGRGSAGGTRWFSRVSGVYPPLALAEAFITEEDSAPRVRRLHLIVVDLHRRRRLADRVRRLFLDIQVDRCADERWNTLPIPWMPNQEAYQLRYVFGYAMDGSDLPCYMLWPTRTVEQSFWCIDAWKGDWIRLDKCSFIAPMGIEHFFDAFCLHPQRLWRAAACHALCIPSCQIAEDTHLEHLPVNKFSLTPRRIPVERKAPADKNRVDLAMVASEESGSEAESGWSGVSDNSSTDSECTNLEASSVASDQDRFETAYDAFRDLAEGLYDIDLTRYSRGVTSEASYRMARRSCRSWCICLGLGH